MATFQEQFGATHVCVDDRAGIGPHHLAIGKTRKLFEFGGSIEAFYSDGYGIRHARLDAETLELRASESLSGIPIAWGGGAFCVDAGENGQVTLVFIHRNRREFCSVRGVVRKGEIAWDRWNTLLATRAPQAAPWVELGPDGTAWCSVLARDGDFRLAIIDPDGRASSAPLFSADETLWYHSCVQVLPVGIDEAVAIGFRGSFPSRTELVFKTVGRDFTLGRSEALAPCNVNDQFTFHFQAVGDPANGRAHIVYLDDGLSVSHALYEHGRWRTDRAIMPFAAYAPQICLDEAGRLALLACDYEGVVWTASWSDEGGWSWPRPVDGLPPSTISGLFGRTGYGTGGLISAARSRGGRVPFLMGAITDEHIGQAKLYAGSLGRRSGLLFSTERPVEVTADDAAVAGNIRLTSLLPSDLARAGKSWVVGLPCQAGSPARLTIAFDGGKATATLVRNIDDGSPQTDKVPVSVTARFHSPFQQQEGLAEIVFRAELEQRMEIAAADAWGETYEVQQEGVQGEGLGTLVDLAPFEPEVAARTALVPHRIPAIYKRMV